MKWTNKLGIFKKNKHKFKCKILGIFSPYIEEQTQGLISFNQKPKVSVSCNYSLSVEFFAFCQNLWSVCPWTTLKSIFIPKKDVAGFGNIFNF